MNLGVIHNFIFSLTFSCASLDYVKRSWLPLSFNQYHSLVQIYNYSSREADPKGLLAAVVTFKMQFMLPVSVSRGQWRLERNILRRNLCIFLIVEKLVNTEWLVRRVTREEMKLIFSPGISLYRGMDCKHQLTNFRPCSSDNSHNNHFAVSAVLVVNIEKNWEKKYQKRNLQYLR